MTNPLFPLPDPNDQQAIELHRDKVLNSHSRVLGLIDSAFTQSVPKARELFKLVDGQVDLSVHAAWTRYLTKEFLRAAQFEVQEEELVFGVAKIANCGLHLSLSNSQIRILKASQNGIPRATSEARRRFYSSNQLVLGFMRAECADAQADVQLNLVVLWDMDSNYSYTGLEIACPRRERDDGTVDCYWIAQWRTEEANVSRFEPDSPSLPSDLDEIRPLHGSKKASG
jgi:hypothetical protein